MADNAPQDNFARRPLSPDDALPPVEPPSAGFILKLFVIPGVIVSNIVLVWLLFNWLAQMGNDPASFVDAIKRNNEGRWQAAVNLANALNNEKGAGFRELRRNHEKVQELAAVLQTEIAGGSMEEKPITFRMFLCRALGSFEVADGLPALLEAVRTNRDPRERDVRRSALEGIALLAENVRNADPAQPLAGDDLQATLIAAAADEDPLVRSSAAFAMGVVGGSEYVEKLRYLLDDAYPDARYNGGTGLARGGNAAAAEVLIEMIDPQENAGVDVEREESARQFKRALISFNGVRGIEMLVQNNSVVDSKQFIGPLETLIASKPPRNVAIEATNLLRTLKKK